MDDELKYLIALTSIHGIGPIKARLLMETFGSARQVLEADRHSLSALNHTGQLLMEQDLASLLARAEQEIRFANDHNIQILVHGQHNYPRRLLSCPDAPAVLYYLGKADLNCPHTISIVGTRACTQYGRDIVAQLLADLREAMPDLLVISGLALGIDISAHRAALQNGLPTLGVVAHGLDRIYPAVHRNTASQMIDQGGGIITEYLTHTEPIAANFLARNRIIAGLSDAVIVAESRDKGGSLVTASIALDYNREVFAFPGRCNDDRSKGCNRLIRLNRAGLITCAKDLLEALGWENKSARTANALQQSIPFVEENLSPSSRLILDALRQHGDLRITQLNDLTGLDNIVLIEELLNLEMDGKIRSCPGGLYQLR